MIGCIPRTAALGWSGYAVGRRWETIANDFHRPTYAIAAIVAVAVGVVLFVRNRRAARKETEEIAPVHADDHRR